MNLKSLVSKKRIITALYDEVINKYGSIYSDEAWQNVYKLTDDLTASAKELDPNASFEFTQGGVYHNKPGEPPYRDYRFILSVAGYEITGTITCCSAGTVEDPWKRYDISCVLW